MMRRDASITTVASRVLSIILHPILVPLYATVFFVVGTPLLAFMSFSSKAFIVGMVATDAVVLPALYIGLMLHFGLIRDSSLSRPSDRVRPLIVLAFCYGLCLWILRDYMAAFLVSRMLWAAIICTVMAAIVTPVWKISLHLLSQGAAVAFLCLLCLSGVCTVWLLCAEIVVAGLLASARLYLGAHNPLQVSAGFMAGFVIALCSALFI